MDAAGRIVLPLTIRERYGLAYGSHRLEVVDSPDGILLRPETIDVDIERDASGWVVFKSGDEETVDPNEAVQAQRRRRNRQITGGE